MPEEKKITKTGLKVLEIIKNSPAPITVKDIIKKLSEQNISVWPSTVYRILDRFLQNGDINKVTMINDSTVYYEFSHHEHLHIAYCLNCKKRQEIHTCPISKLESDILDSSGFEVTEHKIELYGYCKECQKKNAL